MGLGWGVTVSSHPTRCQGQYRAPCRAWSRGFFPQDEFSLGDLGVHSPQWCLQSPLLTELKISDLVVFFSRSFLSPTQVCLALPQLSLSPPSQGGVPGSAASAGNLLEIRILRAHPRALVLCSFMWLSVRCGHRKRHRRHSGKHIYYTRSF